MTKTLSSFLLALLFLASSPMARAAGCPTGLNCVDGGDSVHMVTGGGSDVSVSEGTDTTILTASSALTALGPGYYRTVFMCNIQVLAWPTDQIPYTITLTAHDNAATDHIDAHNLLPASIDGLGSAGSYPMFLAITGPSGNWSTGLTPSVSMKFLSTGTNGLTVSHNSQCFAYMFPVQY